MNDKTNDIKRTGSPAHSLNNTSVAATPIATSSFYATQSTAGRRTPPSLPKRQNTAGSSHTTYIPPSSPNTQSTWREPELVDEDDAIPDLLPSDHRETHSWGEHLSRANWGPQWAPDHYSDINIIEDAFGNGSSMPPIEGRSEEEERNWWDKESIAAQKRPGPGMLPPMLADALHHPEHSLFSVSVTPPDIRAPTASTPPSSPPPSSSVRSSSPPSSPSSSSICPAPTASEVLEAIPHAHSYYCRKHNGWVLLAWKSSTVLPTLADAFVSSEHRPLPAQERRRLNLSCLGNDPQPFGKPNKTHHFHRYERAVSARNLNPGFRRKAWERDDLTKKSRRRAVISASASEGDALFRAAQEDTKVEFGDEFVSDPEPSDEDDLLDLYVCCQCSFYVVVSDIIPGVIPTKFVEEFTAEKSRDPPPGKTVQHIVMAGWETILTVIENRLWKGINKSLSVNGKTFTQKVGWNITVKKIFESFGFTLLQAQADQPATLIPPNCNPATPVGLANRERLLRAWIEISAYLAEYQRRFPIKDYVPHKLWVKVESAREQYQDAIGSHPDQLHRGLLSENLSQERSLDEAWNKLGMTASTYDRELLQFAYYAQCRCDPSGTMEYFTALVRIVDALRMVHDCPQELETMIAQERSRGRFTEEEFQNAVGVLGFGHNKILQFDYDSETPDEFILGAWRDALKRSWTAPDAAGMRRDLNDAIRVVAEARGSRLIWDAWNDEQINGMTPEKAYATLDAPLGTDDEMLITIYGVRVEDSPGQLDKMKNALRVVAEFTNSERIQRFLETGSDPGIIVAPTRPDWPRGLNQLGNTCYLNSLLQYFYTIKDLREAIAPLAATTDKVAVDDKLKDDDLKNHRVGGRMVTRHEVYRSRKFVNQLANLFWHLENSATPAVTPTLELAKLALVTSKDEEEDDGERGATDSSHSTDATLVEEPGPTMRDSPQPQTKSPKSKSGSPPLTASPSVLGKRLRDITGGKRTAAGSDSAVVETSESEKDKDGFVMVSKPASRLSPVEKGSSSASPIDVDAEGDVEMAEAGASSSELAKVPPLPPRPKAQGTSDMMFGRQHDVAECMDNCMFQLETALLRFGELAGSDIDKRSIVKRLFYGKIRQRLSVQGEAVRPRSSVHEREDYFSHLPVNVSEESFDLYDGLSGYFDDIVEYEGTKAKMEVSLVELPPILQIQLQRVQFNRETLQPYKSHAYVKFGETICMDRFLDDAPIEKKTKAKAIQSELTACRDRIQSLTQGKHTPFTDSLENSWTFLSRQQTLTLPEIDAPFLDMLKGEKDLVEREIEQTRARVTQLKNELEEIWRDESRAEYELTSVFVHRGASPSFGHYFIYQRWLPENPDMWFKYNDSDVSVVSKEEVLADTTGSTANPYLLVFAKKGSEVIHTVQRADPMAVEPS